MESPPESTDKNFTKMHVSFQSTGPTNISGVNNNLAFVKLYVSRKASGIGAQKRIWGIEMNEGRATYLNAYWAVDNVNHMIKNAMMRMISWKYWHAAYWHGHAMGVIAAFDIYQACDGLLDAEWALCRKMNECIFVTFVCCSHNKCCSAHPQRTCCLVTRTSMSTQSECTHNAAIR